MSDDSIEKSLEELELLLHQDLSPSTKTAIESLKKELKDLRSMDIDDEGYPRKQQELLRTEYYTQKILAKDAKFESITSEYAKLAKEKRFVELGDYHRSNLYHLKLAAKEMVDERNAKKKQEMKRQIKVAAEQKMKGGEDEEKLEHQEIEKEPNLLDGRPWEDVLKDLDEEDRLYKEWRCNYGAMAKKGQMVPDPPKAPMTKFISDAAARCQRAHTLAQARFEIEQYRQRNEIAHIGTDEIIADAKIANNGESEHWRTLAQIVLNELKSITEGDIPESLRGREAEIAETLFIYQANYFKILTVEVDAVNDVWMPNEVVVAERYLPRAVAEGVQHPNIKQRALAFRPTDTWEKGVVEEYLAAAEEEEEAKEELNPAEAAYSDAAKRKAEARREHGKAHQKLKNAGLSFLAMENYRRKKEEDAD
jgi:hypothetical protein